MKLIKHILVGDKFERLIYAHLLGKQNVLLFHFPYLYACVFGCLTGHLFETRLRGLFLVGVFGVSMITDSSVGNMSCCT